MSCFDIMKKNARVIVWSICVRISVMLIVAMFLFDVDAKKLFGNKSRHVLPNAVLYTD